MNLRTCLLLLSAILILPANSFSEVYLGIGPVDQLKDVRAKFPNAEFERMRPAWAQDYDIVFKITGQGLSGTIIINFTSIDLYFHQMAAEASDSSTREMYEALAETQDSRPMFEDDTTVNWVRWLPTAPIPLLRFVSKYGKPDVSGFTDADLEPYRTWSKRGITAFLSDDSKFVTRVDFSFTQAEYSRAYRQKGLIK